MSDLPQKLTPVDSGRVNESLVPHVMEIKNAARMLANINLQVVSGFRTYMEQLALRKKHVIDKSKVDDLQYLKTANNGMFSPRTAKPGTSNHENGLAVDFAMLGKPKTYAWMKENAHKYGWVRTVPSEIWHWEYRPDKDKYDYVPKNHPSWT